jgi:kanamycin kinase
MIEQKFIDWAKKQLKETVVIEKEEHGDQSTVFKLSASQENYFLKIGTGLEKELERLRWLDGKLLPIPRAIDFIHIEDTDALLLSAIEGTNLAKLCKNWSGDKVVDKLSEALHKFHNTEINDCPFGNLGENKVLIHGDACLPNFIFQDDSLSGYIDLGDMRVDYPEIDLCAAVWSLQYNLGSGYGLKFLQKYGIEEASEKLVEKLILRYEKMQKEWGLS